MTPEAQKIVLYSEPPKFGVFEKVTCPQCRVPKTALKALDGKVYLCPTCRKKNRKTLPPEEKRGVLPRRFRFVKQADNAVPEGFPFFSFIIGRLFGIQAFRISYRKTDAEFGIKRFYVHLVFLWRHLIIEI